MGSFFKKQPLTKGAPVGKYQPSFHYMIFGNEKRHEMLMSWQNTGNFTVDHVKREKLIMILDHFPTVNPGLGQDQAYDKA